MLRFAEAGGGEVVGVRVSPYVKAVVGGVLIALAMYGAVSGTGDTVLMILGALCGAALLFEARRGHARAD